METNYYFCPICNRETEHVSNMSNDCTNCGFSNDLSPTEDADYDDFITHEEG